MPSTRDKVVFFGACAIAAIFVINGVGNPTQPPSVEEQKNRRSFGYVSNGGCMSESMFNSRVSEAISTNNWKHDYVHTMMGSVIVLDEMARLGTSACPDFQNTYATYKAASEHRGKVPPLR